MTSRGITWQWLAKRENEGFLYGQTDAEGKFTGEDIIFIYPDLLTGIRGQFRNGNLVSGSAVDIIGERCLDGLKEIEVRPAKHDPNVIWRKEVKNDCFNNWSLEIHLGKNRTGVASLSSWAASNSDGPYGEKKCLYWNFYTATCRRRSICQV